MVADSRAMTIRLPDAVYELLRREAFERRIPMTAIITDALREHLEGRSSPQTEA
jgi:predicted transcriptional regulator